MHSDFRSTMPAFIFRAMITSIAAILLLFAIAVRAATPETPIRVAIVGLAHEHAGGLLRALPGNSEAQLVGIAEQDSTLVKRFADEFHLSHELFFTNTEEMLERLHPDAVLIYTDILDHRKVIEMAARHGIHSMVEKPLATTVEDALAIRKSAREHHVQVLVNYETTWYASSSEVFEDVRSGELGDIRRAVFYDGNRGPKEMHVSPEFLHWLTDPLRNGAGALFDFGCYGADLMTVLMKGETPLSVTAVAVNEQPENYHDVDDDATVIVRYAKAQAVLQPSWNWTFARKDMEVYGTKGYEITVAGDHVRKRVSGGGTETEVTLQALAGSRRNSLAYLAAVLRNQVPDRGEPSSLDTNMIVVQILAAARDSVKTGRSIPLRPLPK